MKTKLLFAGLLALFSGLSHAALPDSVPTTRSQARIYAQTHGKIIERLIYAEPTGDIKVIQNGLPADPWKRIVLPQPVSGDVLMSTVRADKFRFSLPTNRQSFRVEYKVKDAAGNIVMQASNGGKVVATGNAAAPWAIPDWMQGMYFDLNPDFMFEVDSPDVAGLAQLVDANGVVRYEWLSAITVGGKYFLKMKTDWFDSEDWQEGLFNLYANGEFRQYDNRTGLLAGIYPVAYVADPNINGHFIIPASSAIGVAVQSQMTFASYGNQIEDPSCEWRPMGSDGGSQALIMTVVTTEGAKPLSVEVTEQDENGNVRPFGNLTMTQFAAASGTSFSGKVGKRYFLRFIWPEFVKLRGMRG
jgi:hypothetical protein